MTNRVIKSFAAGLVIAASVVGFSSSASASVYNTTTDYSLAANPNGAWAYGTGTGGSSFTAFTNSTSNLFGVPNLEAWTDAATWPFVAHNSSATTINAFGWFVPTDFLDLHPGPAAVGKDAIVQWTAPIAGLYSYAAEFQPLNGPAGAVTEVFLNGTILNSDTLTSLISYSGLLSLNVGDRLSFVVNNGGGFPSQSTGLKATIGTVPEPTTIALISMALLSLFGFGLMRRRAAA